MQVGRAILRGLSWLVFHAARALVEDVLHRLAWGPITWAWRRLRGRS